MGLQSHQFNGTRKSKWRTQLDYAGVQHQTQYQYPGRSRFDCQTQELEITLQGKSLAFAKNEVHKAAIRLHFLSN